MGRATSTPKSSIPTPCIIGCGTPYPKAHQPWGVYYPEGVGRVDWGQLGVRWDSVGGWLGVIVRPKDPNLGQGHVLSPWTQAHDLGTGANQGWGWESARILDADVRVRIVGLGIRRRRLPWLAVHGTDACGADLACTNQGLGMGKR